MDDLEYQLAKLAEVIANLKALNLPEEPTRSRELSVTITHLETSYLWLKECIK